jgi:hypothetical protein
MAGASHSGKIKPGGLVSDSPSGTTFTRGGTHAPELRRGSNTTSKGKIASNGVVGDSPRGTTFPSAGKEPFDTPNADKTPRSTKVISSGTKEAFVPKGKGLDYGDEGGMEQAVKNPPVKKR